MSGYNFAIGAGCPALYYVGSFLAFFGLALGVMFPNATAKLLLGLAITGVTFAAIIALCLIGIPLVVG